MSRHSHCNSRLLLSLVFALLVQSPGSADDLSRTPQLALPLECDAAAGCLIQNYFDHDSGPGFADQNCGALGYDGHKGLDFRLKNLSVMRAGVPVRAAAAGRVRAIRDEMPDISIREKGRLGAVAGREAGNSVVIQHGGGWETQYGHLRRGSVRVRPGDEVSAGQVVGLVGLSGKTEFPHVHFGVRYHGQPVDPFVGLDRNFQCGDEAKPLWNPAALRQLAYRPTAVIQAGFTVRKPDLRTIESGGDSSLAISPDADAIVFWVEIYGIQQGDEQVLTIYDPQGGVLAQRRQELPKKKAQWFTYVGKKRRQGHWPAGRYRGEFGLYRLSDGRQQVLELSREVEVRITN